MVLINSVNQNQNRLLALLPKDDYERLHAQLEPVELGYRRSLYQANKPIEHVHFLESGVGSLVNTMKNGDASEVGTIGNEGLVGLPVIFGDGQAPTSVYMQVPGAGLRMAGDAFLHAFQESASLRAIMLRYAHAFFNQVAQSAACNHFHSLEQRCCRWLLMTHDRMHADEFLLTHEFLAMMLGVRRAGVTVAAGDLQRDGLIRYTRGHITILNIEGLRERSCECYAVSKLEFDRLLGSADDLNPKRPKPQLGRYADPLAADDRPPPRSAPST
jgi:CRP-like cAMP-binding protein